jgi:hypothetical protein
MLSGRIVWYLGGLLVMRKEEAIEGERRVLMF